MSTVIIHVAPINRRGVFPRRRLSNITVSSASSAVSNTGPAAQGDHPQLEQDVTGINRRPSIISISSDSSTDEAEDGVTSGTTRHGSEEDRDTSSDGAYVDDIQQDICFGPEVKDSIYRSGESKTVCPFLDAIKEDVLCSICNELLWDPYMLYRSFENGETENAAKDDGKMSTRDPSDYPNTVLPTLQTILIPWET
ncbi:hypothetical protein V5O48_006493 [Marasmius crinis-equi]|uniref:Uncharacterized protein n=1 Tax=Marasmius crinis-equi TaxID=585013 RepID=A0ABR3FJF2_9AGAR